MKEYITLTVDGKSVKIEKGSTLLEAARKAGADIPTLCHDERVKPYGACGMCVVECKGSPKLMRSCAIEAADGMEIITESDRINRARRFSLEMLLSDHTGDCKAPCSPCGHRLPRLCRAYRKRRKRTGSVRNKGQNSSARFHRQSVSASVREKVQTRTR